MGSSSPLLNVEEHHRMPVGKLAIEVEDVLAVLYEGIPQRIRSSLLHGRRSKFRLITRR